MLSYRNITEDDCDFILQNWVGNSSVFGTCFDKNELLLLIQSWNTKRYKENYFEMFGIVYNDILVGTFSLYQQHPLENAVCLGVEIDKGNRGKGFATKAVLTAFALAKGNGYEKVLSQVRVDNIASVKLHTKCGFSVIGKTINKRGREVYDFVKTLE